jgi:hypothetical protein
LETFSILLAVSPRARSGNSLHSRNHGSRHGRLGGNSLRGDGYHHTPSLPCPFPCGKPIFPAPFTDRCSCLQLACKAPCFGRTLKTYVGSASKGLPYQRAPRLADPLRHFNQEEGQPMRQNRSKRIVVKAAILLLLVAVVGLSVAAKHGQFLPQSHPLHRLSKAVKMELLHHPVDFVPAPAHPVSRIVPPQPEFSPAPLVQSEPLTFRQIGLTVSFQHRAPPSWLA